MSDRPKPDGEPVFGPWCVASVENVPGRLPIPSDGPSRAARVREIGRDGDAPETLAFIEEWRAAERTFLAARQPWKRANLVACGTPDGWTLVRAAVRGSS